QIGQSNLRSEFCRAECLRCMPDAVCSNHSAEVAPQCTSLISREHRNRPSAARNRQAVEHEQTLCHRRSPPKSLLPLHAQDRSEEAKLKTRQSCCAGRFCETPQRTAVFALASGTDALQFPLTQLIPSHWQPQSSNDPLEIVRSVVLNFNPPALIAVMDDDVRRQVLLQSVL